MVKKLIPNWLLLVLGIICIVMWAAVGVKDALATPAQQLAASKGITVELAESDLAAQERAGDITTDLRTTLGSHYGGVWFDLKTGYFMVALPPGASKSAAQSVMYDLPAKYPA